MPGGSWITGTIGYIIIALDLINQAFVEQGFPNDAKGWITFLIGIATGLVAIFAKDFNKSNAPVPVSTHTVP